MNIDFTANQFKASLPSIYTFDNIRHNELRSTVISEESGLAGNKVDAKTLLRHWLVNFRESYAIAFKLFREYGLV